MIKKVGSNIFEESKYRGQIVRQMNLINLFCSMFLSIIFLITYKHNKNLDIHRITIFPCIIFVRAIGRSCEIVYAFFRDTMDGNKKTSDIKAYERIYLALFSLLEITMLYSSIYWFFDISLKLYTDAVFFSFGTSILLLANFPVGYTLQCLFMTLQIITCMVLIILTIARYVGEINSDK